MPRETKILQIFWLNLRKESVKCSFVWSLFINVRGSFNAKANLVEELWLATLVEGDPKALFSIATTLRCRGGQYSIPWIAPLYPWYLPYNAECLARRNQVAFLESLAWLDLGLNPGLPDHWRTLLIRLMIGIIQPIAGVNKYICSKVNVIALLKFELVYDDVTVHFSYYTSVNL